VTARRIPVFVVVPPRTLLLDIAGPLEVLRRANVVQAAVRFDVRYLGPAASVTSSIGLRIGELAPLPRELPGDAMVMLAGDVDEVMAGEADADAEAAQAARAAKAHGDAIVKWLRAAITPGHTLVTICSGALLAARAGLLDGHACTTHHSDCAILARLAPRARVLENRLFVEDGRRLSSAGVTAGIDLMLHVVSQLIGSAHAASIARYLVVYLRRSGTDPQLSPWLEGRNHLHPAIHRLQDAMTAEPTRPWPLRALAKLAGASPRHVSRLFNEHTGMSIADYRARLRVALARELLGHTHLDLEHVAERVGFGSTRQLRRAWRRLHPTPPRSFRASRADPAPPP
jgi:transcriptional regulator GlxA family with amidase domain